MINYLIEKKKEEAILILNIFSVLYIHNVNYIYVLKKYLLNLGLDKKITNQIKKINFVYDYCLSFLVF